MNHKLQYKLKNGGISLTLGCVLLVAAIILFQIIFQIKIRTTASAQMQEHLKEISQQASSSIKTELEYCQRELNLLTDVLNNFDHPLDENIIPLLQDFANSSKVNRFAVITKNGQVYNSSSTLRTTRNNYKYAEEVFKGKSGFSDVFESSVTGEDVISLYEPVFENGEVIAGVFGTIVVEDLDDMVQFSGFNGEGYMNLIQENGDIVMWTRHHNRPKGFDNYFEFLDVNADAKSITSEELRKLMDADKEGIFSYSNNSLDRKAYFYPVDFNDWYLISIVPKEVFDNHKDELSDIAFVLTVVNTISFILFSIIVFIWLKANEHRLKAAYYKVASNNKKYQMAMVYAQFHVFEYNVTTKKFIDLPEAIFDVFAIDSTVPTAVTYKNLTPSSHVQLSAIMNPGVSENEITKLDLQKKDGDWVRLTVSSVNQMDGLHLIGVVEDITDLKEVQTQFAQEEQYCQAMLGQAILGFSMNLNTRKLLSFFQEEHKEYQLSEDTYFDDQLLDEICANIHPDYRKKIAKIYSLRELKRVHHLGIKEISEHFMVKPADSEDYIWASTVIHFLQSSTDGSPIIFAYVKNVNEKKKRELELEYQSERDGLTELYNRITFVHKVESFLQNTPQKGCCALLLTDLDGFKIINDTLGHQAGDALLCNLGQTMINLVDATQYVGRLGGDEFILFLHGFKQQQEILALAETLCRKVGEIQVDNYESATFTISVGAVFYEDGQSFEDLYRFADIALYNAKRSGKNQVKLYDPTLV